MSHDNSNEEQESGLAHIARKGNIDSDLRKAWSVMESLKLLLL